MKQQDNLIALLTKPPPKDDMRDALITKALNGDGSESKMATLVASMGNFMTSMSGTLIQVLHTQAELQQGPSESPVWGLAGKLIDGYFGLSEAGMEEMSELAESAEKEQKALPAGSAPETEEEDAELVEDDDEQGEEEEVEEEGEGDVPLSVHPINRLDYEIQRMAPLKDLSDALCMAVCTPRFVELFRTAKGDLRALVSTRYARWVAAEDITEPKKKAETMKKRFAYLQTQLPRAWKVAQQRGLVRGAEKKEAAKPETAPAKVTQFDKKKKGKKKEKEEEAPAEAVEAEAEAQTEAPKAAEA